MLSILLPAKAQQTMIRYGITFEHGTWKETLEKAKRDGKLIFADVYTQWCGPCYNMAKTVFTLPDIGQTYNTNFVSIKIDAENGEGKELARRYQVSLFPTYLFIDPVTEEVVHRSSSTQTPEVFLMTAQAALDPHRRSTYVNQQYDNGNRTPGVLKAYIQNQYAMIKREKVNEAFDQLIQQGAKLEDPNIWNIYVTYVNGINNHLKYVSDHYSDFCNRYTKKAVDKKLSDETTYGDADQIEALCNYDGKEQNLSLIRLNRTLRQKKYAEAKTMIDRMLNDSTADRQKVMRNLMFEVRQATYDKEIPESWFAQCVEYARYIAYNWADRDDATVHQLYANLLETAMLRYADSDGVRQMATQLPRFGAKEYSMRPADLKMKPKRKAAE